MCGPEPWNVHKYVWYIQCQRYISLVSSAELILPALLWKILDCMSHWKWSVAQFYLQHWPAEWQDTGPTLWTVMKGDALVWIWVHSRQVYRCSMCLIFSRLWSGVINGTKWVQDSNVSGSFELFGPLPHSQLWPGVLVTDFQSAILAYSLLKVM